MTFWCIFRLCFHGICHRCASHFSRLEKEFGSSCMWMRRALARQPNSASWDHVPLASRSWECKPIGCELRLHLFNIISPTGWPLSGYASNWIKGTDTIACMKPWLYSFTLYCAYSLIHSHMCTLCICLYKSLCIYVCLCERLQWFGRLSWCCSLSVADTDPENHRVWGGQGSAAQPTNKRPCQAGRRPRVWGGGWRRGGGGVVVMVVVEGRWQQRGRDNNRSHPFKTPALGSH